MSEAPAPRFGKGMPTWSADDDAKLLAIVAASEIKGRAAWKKVAEQFSGRSFAAVRQRLQTLRNKETGVVRIRLDRTAKAKRVSSALANVTAVRTGEPLAHTTITATIFGDPLPGRSALDKMRSAAR